jgi:iron complex outermembrane receptor protein
MVEKILSRSVRLMFAGSMVIGMTAFAQEAVQRVEVTGSSIKKIASETALPVQTLSKSQIEQTGATTAADLIASLPSMQGFTTSSASINGGGAGAQTASVHGIGENYTLVLLNGRRMAPFTSGSTVNLANIPLSAVERIEILTDGASALYGSDAIAGVVNFILKKNQKDFNIDFTYSTPQESPAGRTTNFAISKGWGDLSTDGYNVLLAYSRDEQKELNASDRDYAKLGGLARFKNNGKNYSMFMNSINSIPGNVELADANYDIDDLVNPYLVNNGRCPAANTEIGNGGTTCRFNYAATVQILPELKRDNFFGSVNVNLNADHKFFAEGMMTKFTSTARYAPPAQPLGIDLNSNYYKNIIAPAYVKAGGDPSKITQGTMYLRLVDAGGRTDAYKTESNHLSTGFDGVFGDWSYNASYVFSENKATDSAVAGYTSGEKLEALIKSGAWNPFAAPTAASQAALAPAVLRQELDNTKSQINVLSARASRELFKMDGGNAGLGLGADFTKQTYVYNPSPIAQGPNKQQPTWTDTNVGGGTGALPIDATRNNWGGFAELQLPVMKSLELTVAARYDSYDAVKNAKNFDDLGNLLAPATQGTTQSAATYKLAAAYKPNEGLMVRSSFGTGFKAPVLTDITNPLKNGGSSNFFPCPIPVTTSATLKGLCRGTAEYSLLTGGNAFTDGRALKPEKSTQWTLGFRVEPIQSLSLGMDMWSVELKDQIKTLSQATVFKDTSGKYLNLFTAYYDPIQKQNVLAGIFRPTNIANAKYSGVDWDHTFKTNTSMGKVSVNWTGTYMLKADLEKEKGSPVEKTVGNFNSYNDVTFRIISKLATSWKPSDRYTHSATVNYHSSYKDQSYTAADRIVRDVNADGSLGAYVASSRTVAASYTVDLQSKVFLSKNFTLTGGIKNLFNQDPPFSQRNAGGGNQLGFDARYAETLGRQFYLVGNIKF